VEMHGDFFWNNNNIVFLGMLGNGVSKQTVLIDRFHDSSGFSVCIRLTFDLLTPPLPGPDGGRRGQRAALHAGGELPDGQRHREELGRHEAPVGLHLRAREARHRLAQLQNPTDGAAHEPHQEQGEDHRGGVAPPPPCVCVWRGREEERERGGERERFSSYSV